jgi:hypothetical protein
MSKAHQAPPRHRPRYRYVAEHAIERLRERIRMLDIAHRLDSDVALWIDHAVEHAIRRGDVKVIDDRGEPARIVDISADLDAPTYALVKSNARADSDFGEAVVTIVDQRRLDELEAGRWKSPKFGSLAEKLAGVTIGPSPKNGDQKPPEKPKVTEADPDEVILVECPDQEHPGSMLFKKLKRAELSRFLIELALSGQDASKVHIWRQTKAQVKLDVIIEGI